MGALASKIRKHKYCVVMVVLLGVLGFGPEAWRWMERSTRAYRLDPHFAPAADRHRLSELLQIGYGDVPYSATGGPSTNEAYYPRVRDEVLPQAVEQRSGWYAYRMLGELGKSNRVEDAGFLLRMSMAYDERWMSEYALQQAKAVAQRCVALQASAGE
jgi:hypothetical protein